jgi:UDP-N-acetylbacillosamine N-acetyltransferase
MKLIILGSGGYGKTISDIAEQNGRYEEILFLDDNSPIAGGKCHDFKNYISEDTEFYPAFGNNEIRLRFIDDVEASGGKIATVIHSTAYISPKARIEKGVSVLPKAVVNTGTVLEKGVLVNAAAVIDHDCIIEEGAHICIGALIKAENKIPAKIKIEAGEVIENRKYPRGDK